MSMVDQEGALMPSRGPGCCMGLSRVARADLEVQ